MGYDHIGDIDVDIPQGLLYGGMEGGPSGVLGIWNTTDLSFIRYEMTDQKGMPWVALDPSSGYLYSAVWNDCCTLQIYDSKTLSKVGTMTITGDTKLPPEIQGGAFYQNDLYVATNQDDGIWKIDMKSGTVSFVLSDSYRNHEYEMEGLTFWDLSDDKLGVMHMYGNFMQAREKCIRSYSP